MQNTLKGILVLLVAVLSVGCCGSKTVQKMNATPVSYADALKAADKSCTTDADCTAVKSGCCLCDGETALSVSGAQAVKSAWMTQCEMRPCTMQMCYLEINTSCVSGKCEGKLKDLREYGMAL